MLRIAICVNAQSERYVGYAERYAAEKETESIAVPVSAEELLARYKEFDAAFIDAEDGVGLAEGLRGAGCGAPIVFIGGQGQFSVKGKGVDTLGFLPEPVSYYAFSTMLDRVQVRLVKCDVPTVALMTKQGARRISVNDIAYIENSGLNVIYHMVDGDIKVHGSMSDVEKKVTADRFFRLRGYLINLEHVHKVSGADVYVGSACLPLPYNKKAALCESLLAYMDRG